MPLRLPAVLRRRRPPDLLYAADERPPALAWLILAAQHAGTALALTAYALVAASVAGLSPQDTRSFLALSILAMAVATLLQSWGGRTGSASLLVHIPAPGMLGFTGAALAAHGPGGLFAVGLVTGAVALAVSLCVDRLRSLFPPSVAGAVVCLVGLSLVPGALRNASGLGLQGAGVAPAALAMSGVTLAVIVGVIVWGGRRASVFGLALGMFAGVAMAIVLDGLPVAADAGGVPWLALPAPGLPSLAFDPMLLIGVALTATLSQLDVFGGAVMLQRMDDADWRRVDLPRAAAALRAGGLANLLGGCVGAQPVGLSSANIGLCHVTRCTSRWVGLGCGLLLAVVACMPKVALALTLVPGAVLGGVQIYAAAYLMVSGMQLIVSRALDVRAHCVVGLSLLVGVGLMSVPLLAQQGPGWLQQVTASGFVAGGLVAVIGNLLTRLGVASRARLQLDPATDGRALTDWMQGCAARWGVRRDVAPRVAQAGLEALEWLRAAGRAPSQVEFHFDELRLRLVFRHAGPALPLRRATAFDALLPDLREALQDDAALDRAMARVPAALVSRLADRVSVHTGARGAELRLAFEH
ncbi:hypothetical protein FOZ76_10550 [Verticiella sediminum]|uniref:Xanthine/uracil permease n=1 Tax=Verticiella sediminum TaxID=1247510 RepID=A0A556ASC2_9BURK|nr:solute carrier family 23 protein [Verticiella sediminum]TSH95820.1 hypothetical protein FOZ76_10550 [Verticiella sediminum]